MSKVRINDLARELEVKSKAILDALADCGVTEKKTHSSSLEADEAVRVRAHFARGSRGAGQGGSRQQNEPKPKIDWSRVSKPGDVLKAIQERNEQETVAAARPAAVPVAPKAPVSAPPAARPSAPRPAVTAAPPP
ncbi:translation initiation factor IF-2 N-terminal domain-containing protein, partial [Acidobacterium sp.]